MIHEWPGNHLHGGTDRNLRTVVDGYKQNRRQIVATGRGFISHTKGFKVLVLTRKKHEVIVIGDIVRIKILSVAGDSVKIGIEAPKEVSVHRLEIHDAMAREAAADRSDS